MTRSKPRVHPRVRAFDRVAEAYERGRPDYPGPAIRFLARELGLGPGRIVVELGSGTGKLTRSLAASRSAIVAIEPMAGMRRVFRRVLPATLVLDGTAERIPLPTAFADAVVAAQAFQWFRTGPAMREIDRVLRPGGRLALLWNVRLSSTRVSRGINEVHDRCARALPPRSARRWGRTWRRALKARAYGFGLRRKRSFRHRQLASREALVQATLSESAVGLLPLPAQRKVGAEIRAILAQAPAGRCVRVPYRTDVYVIARSRRRSAAARRATRRSAGTRRSAYTSPGSGRPDRRTGR
jgi:ubiquinone/menaquinone biosynthesis C-methylase UbiE